MLFPIGKASVSFSAQAIARERQGKWQRRSLIRISDDVSTTSRPRGVANQSNTDREPWYSRSVRLRKVEGLLRYPRIPQHPHRPQR